MIDVTKLLIITNNDVTEDYFKGQIRTEMVETHKDVLLKVRDYIYAGGWKLITHPITGLKAKQAVNISSFEKNPENGGMPDMAKQAIKKVI